MRFKLMPLLLLTGLLGVLGYTREVMTTAPPAGSDKALPAGYALLFGFVAKEKNLSKLLIVKRESVELGDVVKEISDFAKKAHEHLEVIARRDAINLEHQHLPPIETATRARIEREKAKQLFGAKGDEFEFSLLLTQNEGLSYASNLARTIAEAEVNPARRGVLLEMATSFEQLQARVLTILRKGRS
jgi:hypothetical protein